MATTSILFLTNSEFGQATVCLAVAHEFLIRPQYAVHIASFSPLELVISQLNTRAAILQKSGTSTATFHTITGKSMMELLNSDGNLFQGLFSVHKIGFYGALEAYTKLAGTIAPWTGEEYITAYRDCVDIIKNVQPSIVAVDPLFAQGLDACRMLECKYVVLSPNTLKDHVVQPMLGNLWKYPILCSGYSYPLPWKHVLPNAYLAINLGATLTQSPVLKKIDEHRHSEGLKGPYPVLATFAQNTIPLLLPSRPETDFPAYVPKNITLCGPILRPCHPLSEESPELTKWLSQRPTILINLGSHVRFNITQTMEFADGLRRLFDKKPDIQVLWKFRIDESDELGKWHDAFTGILGVLDDDRVRLQTWLPVEPISILQSGHVSCMVHHGGANSYNEAIRAGVPQIVLPVWFDTYDFAARVEYLGIGVWGSKSSSPAINGLELGKAFIYVLDSEASTAMRDKARSIASTLESSEGRVVACEKIIELIEG